MDVLYVHPEGEGHGCPESKMPLDLEMELRDVDHESGHVNALGM